MDDKLTRKSQEALSDALQRASAAGNPNVDGLHLLAALLDQEGGIAVPLLRAAGADPARWRARTKELLARLPQVSGATVSAPETSRQLLSALAAAAKRAREMTDEYVSTEHLLVGLAAEGGQAANVLRERRCDGGGAARRRSSRCAVTPGSPRPTPRAPTRRWRSTAST